MANAPDKSGRAEAGEQQPHRAPDAESAVPPHPFSLPRSHRLRGKLVFAGVYARKMRKNIGPLSVAAALNGLPHNRLGLSVSRRVGTAVRRNRIKRLIREAFRLHRHDWPTGMDLIVIPRPHEPQTLADYARMLGQAVQSLSRELRRRQRRGRDSGAANEHPTQG